MVQFAASLFLSFILKVFTADLKENREPRQLPFRRQECALHSHYKADFICKNFAKKSGCSIDSLSNKVYITKTFARMDGLLAQ